MTEKERLIELITAGLKLSAQENTKRIKDLVKNHGRYNSKTDRAISIQEELANYLLENGVIVPPVKVGDTVYCIEVIEDIGIDKGTVYAISYTNIGCFSVKYISGLRYDHPHGCIGKTVFLTREEAEKALKEKRD